MVVNEDEGVTMPIGCGGAVAVDIEPSRIRSG